MPGESVTPDWYVGDIGIPIGMNAGDPNTPRYRISELRNLGGMREMRLTYIGTTSFEDTISMGWYGLDSLKKVQLPSRAMQWPPVGMKKRYAGTRVLTIP